MRATSRCRGSRRGQSEKRLVAAADCDQRTVGCRRLDSLLEEDDSNHRSLSGRIPLFRLVLPAGGVEEACSEKPPVLWGGLAVRIRLPPPASLSHQCLPCLPPQRPGFCRECEPGRDQRTGRAGPEPARLGCFSLTGIAAVPPREIKAQQREEPRSWPGHPLLRVALQLARRLR